MTGDAYPLDLARTSYSYVERPNPAILSLLTKHLLATHPDARILDIGCGCGANGRAVKEVAPGAHVVGLEPSPRAADLARASCDDVFCGTFDEWIGDRREQPHFDAIVLSDVLEHIADPIPFIRSIAGIGSLANALWVVSVPNYAVWYNRLNTLLGLQHYAWSGLWDRTHLRFYTRRSVRELLEYCGLSIIDRRSTPSLVQWGAPVLRRFFERDVARGDHLALADSGAYRLYRDFVEPVESRLCDAWPDLLGFQVVHAARLSERAA